MTANQFLRIKADLLITVDQLCRLPLAEFLDSARSQGLGEELRDHDGLPVPITECAVRIAECAQAMVASGPLGALARRPVESARGVLAACGERLAG